MSLVAAMLKNQIYTIRGKLALLTMLSVFISACISIFSIYDRTEDIKMENEKFVKSLANNFMNYQKSSLEKIKTIFISISHFHDFQELNPQSESQLFNEIINENSNINNIIFYDLKGNMIVDGKRDGKLNDEVEVFCKTTIDSLASLKFMSIGRPILDKNLGEPILPISYPKVNPSGVKTGAFIILLRLNRFKEFFIEGNLSANSVIGILDTAGYRIYRYPYNNYFSNKTITKAPKSYEPIFKSNYAEGTLIATGADNIERLYGFAQLLLDSNKRNECIVYVGIPYGEINSGVQSILIKYLIIYGLLIFTLGAIAILTTKKLLTYRLMQLSSIAKKIGQGDEVELQTLLEKRDEIGELAEAFKVMLKELKVREIQIKNNKKRYQILFEKMNQAVIIKNTAGEIIDFNVAALKIFGFNELDGLSEDKISENCKFISSDGTEIAACDYPFNQTGSTLKQVDELIVGIFNDRAKSYKWGVINTLVLELPDSDEKQIFTTIVDITDRKRAEAVISKMNAELESRIVERTTKLEEALEELKTANEEAALSLIKEREINDLKTNFISMVSQKFRAPLTVISSSAFLMDRAFSAQDYEKHNKHLKKILLYVESMENLINDLLLLGRGEAGNIKVTPSEMEFISDVKEIVIYNAAKMNSVDRVQFDTLLNSLNFKTDKALLEYAIGPFIINALSYSEPDTKITIKIGSDGQNAIISIIDKGIGFPESELNKVFEPFYKFSNNKSGLGAGLGMAISKRCIELLDGTVKVESELDCGTTIEIKIPTL